MNTPGVQSTISDTNLSAGRDNHITNSNTHNHYGNNVFSGPDPLSGLLQHCALGALHDAAERPDPPKCHKKTRTAILDRVDRWARDKSADAKPILWLSGAAGAGKSAIAQTLIERWRSDGLVVPNFFLWRTAGQRNSKTYVLPTIAFQLTQLLPETEPIIRAAVKNGSIFLKNLVAQVEALIVNPLKNAQTDIDSVVIVIDGLDECCVNIPKTDDFPGQHYEDQQRELLEAITFTCQQVPFLRVLIGSRPERQIRETFDGKKLSPLSLSFSLNNEVDAVADIALYLDCSFEEIRSKHPGINPPWPSKKQIYELVEKSSGQFIYPSTVIKYVSRPRQYPPASLEEVLALRPRSDKQSSHPLAQLDALYTLVMRTVSVDSLPVVTKVLGLMSYKPSKWSLETVVHGPPYPLNIFKKIRGNYNMLCLEKFLLLSDGELSTHLTDLHSILSISANAGDGVNDIRFFHATFSEYLKDASRSANFSICESDVNLQTALLLLKHANIDQSPHTSLYDRPALSRILASYVSNSPPSIDLMKGVWSLLEDGVGDYSLISGSKPSETSQSTLVAPGDQESNHHRPVRDQRSELLKYLQKCNIPELEPSKARRQAVGMHLRHLQDLVDVERGFLKSMPVSTLATLTEYESIDEVKGKKSKRRLWSGLPISDASTRLLQHCALGALHDAAERPDPPRCHEETRKAVLGRIDRWARDKSVGAPPILWLSGAAGAGKSAIAQTLIERWRKDKLIVPNFFLWRTAAKRNQKTCVVPTIAFQIAKLLPVTKPIIEAAVGDGSIFEQNLIAQVEALIVNPLEEAQIDSHPVIIVLDGLDECCKTIPKTADFPGQHHEYQQRELLEAIAIACQRNPSLRVLISSRPERQIRKSFAEKPLTTLTISVSLNDERDTTADITLYLNSEFAGIRSDNPGIKPSWPSEWQIAELVSKSSGQFIYPSMVVKYVARPRKHPIRSLEEVLELQPESDMQEGHPLAELDALYALVLRNISKDSQEIVWMVLGLLICDPYDGLHLPHPLNIFQNVERSYNTDFFERFLFLLEGELSIHLTDLHSLLSLSRRVEDGPTTIGLFHATLSQFLREKSRSGEVYIDCGVIALRTSLFLLKHANTGRPPDPNTYRLSDLYDTLAIYAYTSPPDRGLLNGLWSLLEDEIGDYTLISNSGSSPNLGGFQNPLPGDRLKWPRGPISQYLLPHYQAALLHYLKKCIIPEIEPSHSCQQAVLIHLQYLEKFDLVGE